MLAGECSRHTRRCPLLGAPHDARRNSWLGQRWQLATNTGVTLQLPVSHCNCRGAADAWRRR